jgi:hypothetical protein
MNKLLFQLILLLCFANCFATYLRRNRCTQILDVIYTQRNKNNTVILLDAIITTSNITGLSEKNIKKCIGLL